MLEMTTDPSDEDTLDREPLFSLDGKEFTIPKSFPVQWTLQYVLLTEEKGAAVAVGWALETALGREALRALATAPPRYEQDVLKVTRIVTARVEGREADGAVPKAPEKPQPKRRAPRKTATPRKTSSRARAAAKP